MRISQKWKFAIGTTSRVSSGPAPLHFLMLDIDGPLSFRKWRSITRLCPNAVLDRTRNGFHVYTDYVVSPGEFVRFARKFGADQNWIRIGEKRGYWFLADRCRAVNLDWKVQRMKLHHAC